jgi:hypothetical protein
MAYMNQEKKAKIAAKLKPVLKKYGIKGSLSVHNHSSICLTVKSGTIDFFEDYGDREDAAKFGIQVNPYWYHEHFAGKSKEFLKEAFAALYGADYYNNSDAQIDYFDTAYYVSLNIGKWSAPYQLVA